MSPSHRQWREQGGRWMRRPHRPAPRQAKLAALLLVRATWTCAPGT
ncbi:hypothetical protein [Thiohalocapsa halophila]|nr:hypothetical protein [Thiohalocapsa halophila]